MTEDSIEQSYALLGDGVGVGMSAHVKQWLNSAHFSPALGLLVVGLLLFFVFAKADPSRAGRNLFSEPVAFYVGEVWT